MTGTPPDEWLPGPFISYSRRDLGFAKKLFDALRQRRRDAWVDLEGIEPSEEWLNKLYAAIDASPAFVYIISEDSIRSPYCDDEIRRAAANHKKLIPILCRPVDAATLPPAIAKLQWISFLEESQFEARFDDLIEALDTDLEWNREHTRLLVRAQEWDQKKRDKSYALRGKDLSDAEQWLLGSGKSTERQPTALQTEYIGASARLQKRSRNLLLAGVSAAAAIAALLAIVAFYQRHQAQENARQALSRLLAAHATNDVERNLNLTTLLAMAGYQQAPTFEARQALWTVAHTRPHLAKYFYGQTGRIRRLAFDSQGEMLAAASIDGTVIVWNVETGQPVFRAEPGGKSQPVIAISAEAKLFAMGLADGAVRLWELNSWKPLRILPARGNSGIGILSFSRDGRWLAWGDARGKVSLWDNHARAPLCVAAPHHKTAVIALRFAPDGQSFATLDSSGATLFWNVEACRVINEVAGAAGGRFGAISFDLSKAALSEEGFPEVLLADLSNRRMERLPITQSDFIMSLDFDPSAARVAIGARDGLLHLWQPNGNKIVQSLRGHRAEVTSVVFAAQGRRLASGTLGGEVILWDLAERYPMESVRFLAQPGLASVGFLPDGQRVIGTTRDGKAALWNLRAATSVLLPVALPGPAKRLVWSANGERLAAQTGQSIAIRAVKDGAVVADIALDRGSESQPIFNSDGRYLAYADGDQVFLWNLDRRTKLRVGPAAQPEVAMAFLPDRRTFAFTSAAQQVTLFDLETGKTAQRRISGHTSYVRSLAVSGDEKFLATGGGMYDGNIALWDYADGRLLRTLQPNDPTDVTRLFFSPDNRTLASVTAYSNQLRLWDVARGRLLGAPIRVGDSLNASPAAFSSDGRLLATVENDAIVLRDMDPASWIKAACAAVNRNLTSLEWRDYVGAGNYQPQCAGLPGANGPGGQ